MSPFEVANLIALIGLAALGAAQYAQSRQIRKAVDRLTRADAAHPVFARSQAPLDDRITRLEVPPRAERAAKEQPSLVESAGPDPDDLRKTRRIEKPSDEALAAAANQSTAPSVPEGSAAPSPARAERTTMVPPVDATEPGAETAAGSASAQARPAAADTRRPPPHPPPRKTLLGMPSLQMSTARDAKPDLPSVADSSDERSSSEEVTQVTDRGVELILEAAKSGELVQLDQGMRPVKPMSLGTVPRPPNTSGRGD